MSNKFLEYLRMSRVYNGHVMGMILILSYLLAATLNDVPIEFWKIIGLFIAGLLAHAWGAYNNDRHDLGIDRKAGYCSHKPLVSGKVGRVTAFWLETLFLFAFMAVIVVISPSMWTLGYMLAAIGIAAVYNRFNKSSQFINIVGQFYATFVVLIGMSLVVTFDLRILFIALAMGVNGVYLNTVEADLKDIGGDDINVPKALGVRVERGILVNWQRFAIYAMVLRGVVACLVLLTVMALGMPKGILYLVLFVALVNYGTATLFFVKMSPDREAMKPYIMIQELSAILLISIPFMYVWPFLPLVVLVFAAAWLCVWNFVLWGKPMAPQV